MELKIKTSILQSLMSKAIKGASNNKLIPLTSLVSIKVNDCLELTTTDATNYLYVREYDYFDLVDCDTFEVTVAVDTLAKLVSKMTSEHITLSVQDNALTVKGNGLYKIEIPFDEEGNMISYPNPMIDKTHTIGKMSVSTIKQIITSVKPSLLTTMEIPCYSNYYVGESVIATDTFKISALDTETLSESRLVSAEVMNLLDMIDEDVTVYAEGNKMLFNTTSMSVYAVEPFGIEDYSYNAIKGLTEQSFPNQCILPKNELLNALDRISLFVGVYDKGEISLDFTDNSLIVASKLTNGVEVVGCTDDIVHNAFTCSVDISMLQSQIKAQMGDTVTIQYGESNAIKIVNDKITSVVALLTE